MLNVGERTVIVISWPCSQRGSYSMEFYTVVTRSGVDLFPVAPTDHSVIHASKVIDLANI